MTFAVTFSNSSNDLLCHISANSANPAILPDDPVILLKFSKVSKFTGSVRHWTSLKCLSVIQDVYIPKSKNWSEVINFRSSLHNGKHVTKTSRKPNHTKIVVEIVSNLIRAKTDLEKRCSVNDTRSRTRKPDTRTTYIYFTHIYNISAYLPQLAESYCPF